MRSQIVAEIRNFRLASGFVVMFTFLMSGAVSGQVIQRPPSLSDILMKYAQNGFFDDQYNFLIWNTVSPILESTLWKGRVRLNSTPESNAVNLYVVSRDPGGYFRGLRCNCGYVDDLHAVICDRELIQYFAHLLSGATPPLSQDETIEEINWRARDFLLRWVLGHELGHLLLKHRAGTYYFDSSGDAKTDETAKIDPSQEIAADAFAAESLQSPEDQIFAWAIIGTLIKTLYADALRKKATNAQNMERQITHLDELIFSRSIRLDLPDTGNPHPPWLIRAIGFEETLRSKFPDTVVDTTGYYPLMLQSITVTGISTETGALCGVPLKLESDVALIETDKPVLSDYDLHWHRFRIYSRTGNYRAAAKESAKWIGVLKRGKYDTQKRIRVYRARGDALVALGDFADAAQYFSRVLADSPDDAGAHDNLGFSFYVMGRTSAAIEQWRQANIAEPNLADAIAGSAVAYYERGNRDKATSEFARALAIEPQLDSPDYLKYEHFWPSQMISVAMKLSQLVKARNQ